MTDYGAVSDIVATAGTLIAAAGSIAFSWRGRGPKEPASEDVPVGPQKFIGLLNAVGLALLYYWSWHKHEVSAADLTRLAIAAAIVGLALYLGYYYLVRLLTYDKEVAITPKKTRTVKVLGGFCKTPHANAQLERRPGLTTQDLFKGMQYNKDAVWTRACTALAAVVYVVCYMGAIVLGTTALTSGSFLAAQAVSSPADAAKTDPVAKPGK